MIPFPSPRGARSIALALAALGLSAFAASCGCTDRDSVPKPAPSQPAGGAPAPGAPSGASAPSTPSASGAEPAGDTAGAPAPSAPAAEAKAEDPAAGLVQPGPAGTIRGIVLFQGSAPKRVPLGITPASGCGDHATPPMSETVIVNDGRLANAFVTVSSGLGGVAIPPAATGSLALEQHGCVYQPHVLGMRVGQTLRVHNGDATNHNVNIRSVKNQSMNPTQAPGGPDVEWKPEKKEGMVSFECNLHPWMRAYVCVEEHPFFAVSGADGSFEIAGLPPGEYTLQATHEKYKTSKQKVVLGSGSGGTAVFRFSP